MLKLYKHNKGREKMVNLKQNKKMLSILKKHLINLKGLSYKKDYMLQKYYILS